MIENNKPINIKIPTNIIVIIIGLFFIFLIEKNIFGWLPQLIKTNIESVLIILGWYIVYLTTLGAQFEKTKDEQRIKVYQTVSEREEDLKDILIEMTGQTYFMTQPHTSMDFSLKKYDGYQKSPGEYWFEYTRNYASSISKVNEKFSKYFDFILNWSGSLPESKHPTRIFYYTLLNELSNELWAYQNWLLEAFSREADITKWNKEEYKDKADLMGRKIDETICYLEDVTTGVYNDLVGHVYGRKKYREDFNFTRKITMNVLTSDGFRDLEFEPNPYAQMRKNKPPL